MQYPWHLQHYPRKVCIMNQLCFNKLQTMLLTSFEDSFFWDLIEEVWSKINNSQSKVDYKYELCLINVVVLKDSRVAQNEHLKLVVV